MSSRRSLDCKRAVGFALFVGHRTVYNNNTLPYIKFGGIAFFHTFAHCNSTTGDRDKGKMRGNDIEEERTIEQN